MANELTAARTYLSNRLNSSLSIEAWPLGEVPKEQRMPYATFDLTPEPDRMSKTATEQSTLEAVVRVVGEGSLGPLEAHITAIEEALHFRAGEVGGFGVVSRRIAPFQLPGYFQEGSNLMTREIGIRVRLVLTRVESGVGAMP